MPRFEDFGRYVSLVERKRRAQQAAGKLKHEGAELAPIVVKGTAIAHTFWGRSWCQNIERYSDFRNRLERGRAYVRTGAVVDLSIGPGLVKARVMGSRLYTVEIRITTFPQAKWKTLCRQCSGAIDSLVELLQGHLSKAAMEHICARETGLFPFPQEIAFTCTCPDSADLCKHVAAVLYGIGARLDAQPQLLFGLRQVDEKELIASAGSDLTQGSNQKGQAKRLEHTNLGELFGIEIVAGNTATRKKMSAKKSIAKQQRRTPR